MNTQDSVDFKNIIEEKVKQLRSISGVEVSSYHLSKGISPEKIGKIKEVTGFSVPEAMLRFFTSVNGCQLDWSYQDDKTELYGFWDIWSLEKMLFGFEGRITKANYENPVEDTLWNDDYEEKEIAELKQHRVIESIEGSSSYITCKIIDGQILLYYVNEGRLKKLSIGFENYLLFIIGTLGVEDVREQLVKPKFLENPLSYKKLKMLNTLIPVNISGKR